MSPALAGKFLTTTPPGKVGFAIVFKQVQLFMVEYDLSHQSYSPFFVFTNVNAEEHYLYTSRWQWKDFSYSSITLFFEVLSYM